MLFFYLAKDKSLIAISAFFTNLSLLSNKFSFSRARSDIFIDCFYCVLTHLLFASLAPFDGAGVCCCGRFRSCSVALGAEEGESEAAFLSAGVCPENCLV